MRLAKFSQEHGDAERKWYAHQHGDGGGDDRAVDRRQRAEIVLDRIPRVTDEEIPAELLEGGLRAGGEGDDDPAEQYQDAEGEEPRRRAECGVLNLLRVKPGTFRDA